MSLRVGIFAAATVMLLALPACDQPAGSSAQPGTGGSAQVAYDTKISFGAQGNSAAIKESGWSKTEERFTWTEGNTATLNIPIAPTEARVTLRMTAAGMIQEPQLPTHPVEVYAGDQKIADWQVGDAAPFSAPIPQELTKDGGNLKLTFKMPKAVSPKELGKNEDQRVLGLCVVDLELSTR